MPNVSIENVKLNQLIVNSRKFSMLSPKEKGVFLAKISKLPAPGQEKLCNYFEKENQKEIGKEKERADREKDGLDSEALLEAIKNS